MSTEEIIPTSFEEMDLSAEILRAVQDMGFEKLSPIQEQAIPHLLEGKERFISL